MKLKNLILSIAAISAAFAVSSCGEKLGDPSVSLDEFEVILSAEEQEYSVEFVSTLDWKLKGYTEDVQSWLIINPVEGNASAKKQTLSIAVTKNEGKKRTAEITIYGDKVHNETVVISQNGSVAAGDGSLENPYSASEARALTLSLAADTQSTQSYYIRGFIKKFHASHTADAISQYGNASFYMTDTAAGGDDDFIAFQILGLNKEKFTSIDDLKAGDEVVIYGPVVNYKGNTPETVGKGAAYLYSLNGKTGDGGTDLGPITGKGTAESPYTATDAIQVCQKLTASEQVENVYVAGKISKIDGVDTGTYGNATYYISKDGTTTNQFEIFRGFYFNGDKFTAIGQIKVGDDVVVNGTLVNYNGTTPEMTTGSKIVLLNGKDKPEEGGQGGETSNLTPYVPTDFTFTATTDGTYKGGFKGTSSDKVVTLGYYQGASTSAPIAATDQIRWYKNSTLVIETTKAFSKLVITTPEARYTADATVLENCGGTVSSNTSLQSVTWEGTAVKKLVMQATASQIRISKLEFDFGEGGSSTLDLSGIQYGDFFRYADGGAYLWDLDIYTDYDTDGETYDIICPELYLGIDNNRADKLAGSYSLLIDGDYYGLYATSTEVCDPFTSGTVTIAYSGPQDDSYIYTLAVKATTASGVSIDQTFTVDAYGYDSDADELITLTDTAPAKAPAKVASVRTKSRLPHAKRIR